MREIEVIIEPDGEISFDLVGWKGKGCHEVAEKLTKALGQTIEHHQKKEYWQTDTKVKQKVKRGL